MTTLGIQVLNDTMIDEVGGGCIEDDTRSWKPTPTFPTPWEPPVPGGSLTPALYI